MAFLAQIASALCTAGVTLYLVRALGPDGYGAFALVLSVCGLVLVLADGAVAHATGTFTARLVDDHVAVAVVVDAGLRLKLWLGALAGGGLLVLAGPIARAYGAPDLVVALRIGAAAVVAESLFMLWLVAFQSLRRLSSTVRLYAFESLAEATAVVTFVTLGSGVAGAVAGRAVGYAVGAALGGVLLSRYLGRRIRLRGGDATTRRQVGGYAVPLFVSTGAYSAYGQVDVQIVGALLDRAAVGVFAAPAKLLTLFGYPGQSVANAVSPRMAGADPDVRAFATGMRWILLYHAALVPPVVLWADPVCRLVLGDQFSGSAAVLAALAPYLYLRGVSVLASTTVNYLGFARRRIPIVLLALVVNVVLGLVLVPLVGVVGAALALGASYALYVPLHLRLCAESFDLPVRALAVTVLRSALAASAMAGVLMAVGTGALSASDWFVGTVLGSATYVTVLALTRELTKDDLVSLTGLLAHRRRS